MAYPDKLPRAPLQEVIFQVLWEVGFDEQGRPTDPGYEFAQGRFEASAVKEFPVYRRTMPENSPVRIYPKPVHQFWKGEGHWPLVQLGPGILAVNDTERNYRWSGGFRELIASALGWLEASYKRNLNITQLDLRYIDAVTLPEGEWDVSAFVNRNFRMRLINDFPVAGAQTNLNVGQTFALKEEKQLSFVVSSGTNADGRPAVVWQIAVIGNQQMSLEQVKRWANEAHEITHDTFIQTITDEFYDSFR